MGQYEVVRECYVPVGPGLRYKRPGSLVILSDEDAGKLASYIQPVESDDQDSPAGVAERNTEAATPPVEPPVELPVESVESPVESVESPVEWAGEVTIDAGNQGSGDEPTDTEAY